MSDLREDLDRALRALPVSAAPVERARRDGRRLRTRRRAAVLVGALAVAVVAVGYPALARSTASGPMPSTLQTIKPAPTQVQPTLPNGDPVITGGPAGAATEGPDGLTDKTGAIAAGTMGTARWQVTVTPPGAANPVPADPCYSVTLSSAPAGLGSEGCTDVSPQLATILNSKNPAVWTSLSDDATMVMIGEVGDGVTYLIVTFADGQQLKLLPVTMAGHRYVAWIAPVRMLIASVAAHLGTPYADSGQVATTAPFYQPGAIPLFGLWQLPGQDAPPRDSGVIGSGTDDGHAWKATAYEGPWGTCVIATEGASECVPLARITKTAVLGGWGPTGTALPAWGSAAPGVTTVRIALSNGTAVTAHPVGIGNEDLFAFWLGKNLTPKSWTAYNAAGQQVGSGTVKV
jgi:hypothetical protein